MTEPVFLVALAMAGSTVVLVARAIASAVTGRGAARSEVAQLTEQLERHAAALEDAEAALASQATQLAELHERLDFAERLLTQGGDHTARGPRASGG
jgi:uncharacterized protein YycO